ncbi:fluoride efflux transporter FluC [Aestuariimicrobium ganziense]|uniref:fluoride efflux transporter FluC n=1 Tax=Aestuariimicrobium ganziense TaxID=2773677 RepID=UPI001940A45E|nr:CrcB family protein [Aestuariimicrobium ganziense]
MTAPAAATHRTRHPIWLFALVVLGGSLGTAARYSLQTHFPTPDGAFPLATFAINVVGALMLGVLYEGVSWTQRRTTAARAIRLALGVGVLGGFTTYSSFMVETVVLTRTDHLGLALVYDAGSLAVGVIAALLGAVVTDLVGRTWLGQGRPREGGS